MGLRSSIKYVLLSSFRWHGRWMDRHSTHGMVGWSGTGGQASPFHLFYINFLRLFSSHFTLKYSWSSLASRLPQQPRNYCQTHTVGRWGDMVCGGQAGRNGPSESCYRNRSLIHPVALPLQARQVSQLFKPAISSGIQKPRPAFTY